MSSTHDIIIFSILIAICIVLIGLSKFVLSQKKLKQLQKIFVIIFGLMFLWIFTMAIQIICLNKFDISIKYFYYIYYISICFLPLAYLFMAIIFEKGDLKFYKRLILLFIVPTLSLILLWTNDLHHLFYKEYSTSLSTEYGEYFYVHTCYSFAIFVVALFILLKYTIKNAGFFSKQAILIFIGTIIPLSINILGSIQIIPVSIYATPIAFATSVVCITLAIFNFDFLKITPIALQRIVDRISDGYIVVNEDYFVTDFNQTFLNIFGVVAPDVRNKNLFELIKSYNEFNIDEEILQKALNDVNGTDKTITLEEHFDKIDKYFHIEINCIMSKGNFLGTLILLKDVTQHYIDMQTIKDNQDMLIEKERLASLGQMIGGIAHNLKTPIMSIAGAAQGISDLISEYESSIGDPEVTIEDHHAIASDMKDWIEKIRTHLSYMSDVITAIKGQAVNFADQTSTSFTIKELINYVNILMKHELNNALINLNIQADIDTNINVNGNINSLVQVINNIISNAIQAYQQIGKTNENIDFNIYKEKSNLIFKITDYAGGLPKEVQQKLFKEMVTTKGKNGTGLGLFMSYSNIKAHFSGNLRYTTEKGKGTSFYIEIPN